MQRPPKLDSEANARNTYPILDEQEPMTGPQIPPSKGKRPRGQFVGLVWSVCIKSGLRFQLKLGHLTDVSQSQYPAHVLTVKYSLQKPAISSRCGIDPFSNDIVEPT